MASSWWWEIVHQDEAGMQKKQHPRGLKLLRFCPHPSLQGTPSLLCTRNREVLISRKIIVEGNQPQEVGGWLKLTFAPKERHVAGRQRSSEFAAQSLGPGSFTLAPTAQRGSGVVFVGWRGNWEISTPGLTTLGLLRGQGIGFVSLGLGQPEPL